MSTRIISLLQRAAHIRRLIQRERHSTSPNWLRMMRLNRLSLIFNERLEKAVRQLTTTSRTLAPVPIRATGNRARRLKAA